MNCVFVCVCVRVVSDSVCEPVDFFLLHSIIYLVESQKCFGHSFFEI